MERFKGFSSHDNGIDLGTISRCRCNFFEEFHIRPAFPGDFTSEPDCTIGNMHTSNNVKGHLYNRDTHCF
jgi:hypothetical protein